MTQAIVIASSNGELDAALRRARAADRAIGFVATLGALHRGHASLVEAARRDNEIVVVSVFLNPFQFNDPSDLARYPSDAESDAALASRAGAEVIFSPSVEAMYPMGEPEVMVDPGRLGDVLEGASRPGHFRAVATVVAKLFAIVRPAKAYFGEKDYQQLVIVRRLVADLSLDATVVGCPIEREPDGLAISSRNVFLSKDERLVAPTLNRALRAGAAAALGGTKRPADVEAAMRDVVASEPSLELDYAVTVAEGTLEQPKEVRAGDRLLIAARLGKVRLIDNVAVGS